MSRLFPLLFLCVLWLPFSSSQAQSTSDATLRVFLDCTSWHCDFDYFRQEIPFVSYVRNREDADVHVLVTTQDTGGGGDQYTVAFLGQRDFKTIDESLVYVSEAASTQDEVRSGLARVMRAGFVRYISRTPRLARLSISYEAADDDGAAAAPEVDPWNSWVFSTSVNGFGQGEDSFRSLNLRGHIQASRVTDLWKTRISTSGSRNTQHFTLSDGSETSNVQSSYSSRALLVRSLSSHWSVGGLVSGFQSSRQNIDYQLEVAPAVEANLFPYSASTRKLLALQYTLGLVHVNYADTTIFDQISETRLRQGLGMALIMKQTWGSMELSLEGRQYLHDLSKFNLNLGGYMDVRLFRGFSVDVGGNVAYVRDQLYLPQGDASDEDVLLQRRALATNFRHFFHFGVRYTFGSSFNNVVNPRFSEGLF